MFILGIDAAWTAKEPSGIALIADSQSQRRCLALAPNYQMFVGLAEGKPIDWTARRIPGSIPDPERLLWAATTLAQGARPDVVAVDMPLALTPIIERRVADDLVSKAFGGQGCSAHSPGVERPGPIGAALSSGFKHLGYPLAVGTDAAGAAPCLIEVYPHPALLTLLDLTYRYPYKASKSRLFWPELDALARKERLLDQYERLLARLKEVITGINLDLPRSNTVSSIAALKRFEDALDALVCTWIGACYAQGKAYPLGDESGAVWLPSPELRVPAADPATAWTR